MTVGCESSTQAGSFEALHIMHCWHCLAEGERQQELLRVLLSGRARLR